MMGLIEKQDLDFVALNKLQELKNFQVTPWQFQNRIRVLYTLSDEEWKQRQDGYDRILDLYPVRSNVYDELGDVGDDSHGVGWGHG